MAQMEMGRYLLTRKLATGGMAEVFLAKTAGPMGFEKLLVVKRILPHLAEDPQFVEMFLSEAKLVAKLDHPNIVQIFDFGQEEDAYFIAMEYVEGPNLRALFKRALQQGRRIPLELSTRIVALACEGLAYAHELCDSRTGEPLSIVHRDISTDNLLVSRSGNVKVMDFGIAKAANASQHTRSGILKGKLGYMAPEYLMGQPASARSDLYALGVVLYELVTGRKPFEGESDAQLMRAVLQEPLIDVRELSPETPEALALVIDQALAREPENRYASCHALQAALDDLLLQWGRRVGMREIGNQVKELFPTLPSDESAPPPSSPSSPSTPSARVNTSRTPRPVSSVSGVASHTEATHQSASKAAPEHVVTAALPRRSASRPWVAGLGILAGLGLAASAGAWWANRNHAEPTPVAQADAPRPAAGAQGTAPGAPPAAPPPAPTERGTPTSPGGNGTQVARGNDIQAGNPAAPADNAPHGADHPTAVTARALDMGEATPEADTTGTQAADAPEPTATQALLRIESRPSGQVRLNDRVVGRTPLALSVDPGVVRIELSGTANKSRFDKSARLQLKAGEKRTVSLNPQQLSVTLRGRPDDMTVLTVDGQPLHGPPQVTLYEGRHQLTLRHEPTKRTYSTDCEVRPGDKLCKFFVRLESAQARPE
ncbi:protein kinase [Corallococcus sp. M34]|uniref:serine/threonine protein kinase n=1 Tax=Citreicoccus inhibens TaxID=2849499 RepID=UPI001C21039A|nr:serine/threonine-protein kinase [Citreicoccus inhibens]MBU8895681.1 protein kinase [Citreicoccus inhibens]